MLTIWVDFVLYTFYCKILVIFTYKYIMNNCKAKQEYVLGNFMFIF